MLDKLSGVKILLIFFLLILLPVSVRANYLFDSARQYPVPFSAPIVAAADFTGDGIYDLVTANARLSVLVGVGDGTFAEVLTTTGVRSPISIAVGDVDCDGNCDVVLGDDYGSQEGLLRVLLGSGDGTFHSNETYITVETPETLGLGDLDGDGDLDLVFADPRQDVVAAHLNDGNGTFGPARLLPVGDWPIDLELGFFNGDDSLDLAVVHHQSEELQIHFGNGDGTFNPGQSVFFDFEQEGIDAADLDGDGLPDLVISTDNGSSDGELHVLLGNGNGTFSPHFQRAIDGQVGPPVLAQMDPDQTLDLVFSVGTAMEVWPGNGDGTFELPLDSEVECRLTGRYIIQDLNRDGDPDLAMTTIGGLMVVLNRGDGAFLVPAPIEVSRVPSWTETVDLDQDGDLDVVMNHRPYVDHELVVTSLINSGEGTFTTVDGWSLSSSGNVRHFSEGDLNGDTLPDLAMTYYDFDDAEFYTAILLGVGDGTFVLSEWIDHVHEVYHSYLWLVNGDSHLDLVSVCADGVWVRPGIGDGGFASPVNVFSGSEPYLADAADLDGNATLDLVIFDAGATDFIVLRGDGAGGFSSPEEYDYDAYCHSLNLGDLDHDGAPDLVYNRSVYPQSDLCVRLNDGSGAFLGETQYSEVVHVGRSRLVDLTADGYLDVVSANGRGFSVHPGSGNGGFHEALGFSAFGDDTALPAAGDFDDDGDVDLVVVCGWSPYGFYFSNTLAAGTLFSAGPGRGENNPAKVRTFTWVDTIQRLNEWQAYGVSRYGVNAALGELDGSAGVEVLTGAGPGPIFGPHVRGFEDSGTPLPGVSFFAYGTNKYGVNVAAGDLDADGFDEIVTGAGPGAVFGPHVRGWNWDNSGVTPTPIPGISYFAYGTPKWGVNVCCGDIDGDGYDEIVTGAGPGAVYGPHVRGWNCDGGGAVAISAVSFLAYGTNKFGVNVCCGDIDGDGIDEMVTGAGPGSVFGPHVRGWNWDGSGSTQSIPGISFFAYHYTEWGVNVSCGDLDGDGIDEILTGPGPGEGHTPRIRGWNYDGGPLAPLDAFDFNAFDPGEVTHGVKPAGLRASRR